MTPREELIAQERDALEQRVIDLQQKLESAQFERDELARKIERITSHIRCIYCDKEYSFEQKDELADHILECDKSPLVKAFRKACLMADEQRARAEKADKQCEHLCEEMSEVVSDRVDPFVNAPWMRCSPHLPKYVQGLELAIVKITNLCNAPPDCDKIGDIYEICSEIMKDVQ